MNPPAMQSSIRHLLVLLLLGILALLLRLAYVVTISPSPSLSADSFLPVPFYSAFKPLLSDGFFSPLSKSLSIGPTSSDAALALRLIGVRNSVAILYPPRSIPFGNSTFDFVFSATIERSPHPIHLALEIARVLKPDGFVVVHTSSAGDSYSLHSLTNIFTGCVLIRSREVDGLDPPAVIREVVLRKENSGEAGVLKLRMDESKCPEEEHKRDLVSFAEPLIREEPLKPWITLKRNIKSIRYLPSMVDISFKSRYIYIDVGARSYGSSIGSWFKKQYPKQNQSFEIYAIEADPVFHKEYERKKGVNFLPFAAWVRNETLLFEVNGVVEKENEEKRHGMGRIRPGGGSLANGNARLINGFDLAEWVKSTVKERDFVVMKMDVEGTEFDLIPRFFETGAICLIDELFLECHYNRWQRCCPGVRTRKYKNTYGDCLQLFSSLREGGVLVHQWW